MTYEKAIASVARDLGLSKKVVDRIYRSYWKVARMHITSLPLKEDLSDEEFLKLRPNVNIPSIGKLYVTLDRYKKVKKNYYIVKEIINAAHQEDQAHADQLGHNG